MTNKELIKIYFIRHGEAKASWEEDPDPGLSKKGKSQSELLVNEILNDLPSNLDVISSPLLRARETALPLQNKLGTQVEVSNTYTEIPSPGILLSERKEWLRKIFNAKVSELQEPQIKWRKNIITSLQLIKKDSIVFSHFMVINSVVGWINDSKKVVSFHPDNCSITKIESKEGKFIATKLGKDFATTVQ